MSLYTLYKDLLPPSSVHHAIYAKFTSAKDTNVIVAKANLLQVYLLVEEQGLAQDSREGVVDEMEMTERFFKDEDQAFMFPTLQTATTMAATTARLELVNEFKLHGNLTSICKVRSTSGDTIGQDDLLLSFGDAKMSLIQWSPETENIVTISIHYYERSEFMRYEDRARTWARVDPSSRCGLLYFYGGYLSILPINQNDLELDDENDPNKLPYLPSYVVEVTDIDDRIRNILDIQFLPEYNEPTIAILFQPTLTWAGRLGQVKDTACLIIATVDIENRMFPIIYTATHLPYDSLRLEPIPKPVGGVLLITPNAFIHIDPDSRTVGLAVNSFNNRSSATQLEKIPDEELSLDGMQSTMINDTSMVIVLRHGNLRLLEFVLDGRTVSKITLTEIGNAVVPSCACKVASNYLFLGSAVGDSVLLRVIGTSTAPTKEQTAHIDDDENIYDDDEMLYNTESTTNGFLTNGSTMKSEESKSFQVSLCDTILQLGSITSMTLGAPVLNSKLAYASDLEIVVTTGSGPDGSLGVIKQNLNPNIRHTMNFPCLHLWAVNCQRPKTVDGAEAGEIAEMSTGYDRYVFTSDDNNSAVMELGKSLRVLTNTEFRMDLPTVAIGSMSGGAKIVHVFGSEVVVYDTGLYQKYHINMGFRAIDATVDDSYLLVLCDDGSIKLYMADATRDGLVEVDLPSHLQTSKYLSAQLYRDRSKYLRSLSAARQEDDRLLLRKRGSQKEKKVKPGFTHQATTKSVELNGLDEYDDENLYDSKDSDKVEEPMDDAEKLVETAGVGDDSKADEGLRPEQMAVENLWSDDYVHSLWLNIYRKDGTLEIYSLPDLIPVFSVPSLHQLHNVLFDSLDAQEADNTSVQDSRAMDIAEVIVAAIGKVGIRPYLLIRMANGEVYIYKAFEFTSSTAVAADQTTGDHRLATRFRKVPHSFSLKEPESEVTKGGRKRSASELENGVNGNSRNGSLKAHLTAYEKRLFPFDNIGGYSGVFVRGTKPCWIVTSGQGVAKVHPMLTDGPINAFTSLNTARYEEGFIYSNENNQVHFCKMRTDFDMNNDLLIKKIRLGRDIEHITYHPNMGVYILASSEQLPFQVYDDHDEPVSKDKPGYIPTSDRSILELVSPVTWETVDGFDFDDCEVVTCLRCMSLEALTTESGRKNYIVVGTTIGQGEDVSTRGATYIFDVVEVIPELDNPQTDHKLKLLCREEVKGAVTNICEVNGYVLSTIAQKILVRALEDEERLVGVAFIDFETYLTSVNSLKGMLLLTDTYKGVWFVGFQEEPYKMTVFGKENQHLEVVTSQFLIDNKVLGFAVADIDKNVHIFQYSPYNPQSLGGQRLIRRADFHVGSVITSMALLPQKADAQRLGDDEQENGGEEGEEREILRFMTLASTQDGGIGLITPISERSYKRLQLLSNQLNNGLQHPANLNPRAFRLVKMPSHPGAARAGGVGSAGTAAGPIANAAKGVLDGELIWKFAHSISTSRQREIAKTIGTRVERLLDDLVEIENLYGMI